MTFRQTREVRADISGTTGRVRAWTSEQEPGVISLAVPADRAQITPADARALAQWLEDQADAADRRESPRTLKYTVDRDFTRFTSARTSVWS
ncbi:hypothetical protein [Streptomyces sp. AJS327]|uniref:hypothetical protein n=1 Tax=Streptomyces sp. AJS327 TaxID=2545265 RepID=UPI0015DFDFC3|nr:hypothetical protein [Streptomyces sp. AJS327]